MRYLITTSNGTIIEDTRTLPDSSSYVVEGNYIEKDTYTLIYSGKNANCGQTGMIYINFLKVNNPANNNTKMTLFLAPDPIVLDQTRCPNGGATQIMPVASQIILSKQ